MGHGKIDNSKAKKPRADSAQLVFPSQLRVGDVADEEGLRAEVVGPPKAGLAGKTTNMWIRREDETVQRQGVWEAWRKVRVIRRTAA